MPVAPERDRRPFLGVGVKERQGLRIPAGAGQIRLSSHGQGSEQPGRERNRSAPTGLAMLSSRSRYQT
jgi:hypothetical protein